ncbi:hypothetical protein CKAN_00619700 [Cinnamomum micranthum f. kanehirae]|uniref:Uncharacterized protein n=1 Tax=Cinnamomum micranthum f. kanehirae TaxID=337451 RepID=A0A443NGN7_9MAGN|nr:hypothetical protein CKAN_00619700 [Cinnamomum micranthum f. kanehirae]
MHTDCHLNLGVVLLIFKIRRHPKENPSRMFKFNGGNFFFHLDIPSVHMQDAPFQPYKIYSKTPSSQRLIYEWPMHHCALHHPLHPQNLGIVKLRCQALMSTLNYLEGGPLCQRVQLLLATHDHMGQSFLEGGSMMFSTVVTCIDELEFSH